MLSRSNNIVASELDGDLVMMSVDTGNYYSLDEVGAAIWELLDQPRPTGELVEGLVKRFEVERETCLEDIKPFLAELLAEGILIETAQD
ncbi:MAG: lasso peptide biosynthesis PqqD family chaperone [Vulcanimicrobiota bacterium]